MFTLTVDLSLSTVHLCIRSAIFTSIVPLRGGAGMYSPSAELSPTCNRNLQLHCSFILSYILLPFIDLTDYINNEEVLVMTNN